VPAGHFTTWLGEIRRAIDGVGDADVPCGGCTACCTASQFVHVGPDEADALAHIPAALLFAAPGLPPGHRLMGYDEHGRCPMLVDGSCSIYPHRPRTCRTYDCRVFAAAGIDADRDEVTRRARRWRFACTEPREGDALTAVSAAAHWVRGHAAAFPGGAVPEHPAQLAVLAVKAAGVFLPGGPAAEGEDDAAVAAAIVRAAGEVVDQHEPFSPATASPSGPRSSGNGDVTGG